MKKIRSIKVIKSGSDDRQTTTALPKKNRKTEAAKRCPGKIVNAWVREYHEQKQLAQQAALNMLYNSELPDLH